MDTLGRRRRLIVGCSAIALLAASPVFAQEATGPEPATAQAAEAAATDEAVYSVGEVVVTAQKRSQSINDVPLTITAASGQQLMDQGITEVGDLGRIVPGFTYQPAPTGVPVYTLRGVGYFDESLAAAPAVSIYLDEAPLPFSIMSNGVMFDLERVEVLKGPQGTLFGQNSTGGAINYIAAKPTDTNEAGGTVSYSRFNTVDVQGYASGPLTETLNARLAVRSVTSDGWQKSYTRDDTMGAQNLVQGRLLFDWQPTDRLRASLNINGWLDRGETQAPQVIAITPQNPANVLPEVANFPLAPRDNRAADWGATRDFSKNDSFYQAIGRIEYDLSDSVTLTSLTSFARMDRDAYVDGDGMPYDNVDLRNYGFLESFNQEIRVTADLGDLNLVVGGNYESATSKDHRLFFIGDASNNEIIPGIVHDGAELRTRQDVETFAIFANAEYALTDEFTLIGGLRYTTQDRSAEMCSADAGNNQIRLSWMVLESLFKGGVPVSEIPPGGCLTFDENFDPGPVFDDLNEDNVSWRVGLNWEPNSATLIYGTISRGYKSGSFPTIFATSAAQNAPVTQETLLAYEIGAKLTLSRAQLNLATFYYDYEDKQLLGKALDPNFGVLQALVNVPTSRLYGAEAQLIWNPVDALDVSLAATYIDSEITEYVGLSGTGVPDDLSGSPFPYAPELQIVSDIQYNWNLDNGGRTFIGGGVTHNSATNGGIGNEPLLKIDAYTLIDLRAGYESPDGWRLSVWGRNVTDEYYWVNAQRTQDTTLRITGQPATYGVTFGVSF